jgi:hypothetical protein
MMNCTCSSCTTSIMCPRCPCDSFLLSNSHATSGTAKLEEHTSPRMRVNQTSFGATSNIGNQSSIVGTAIFRLCERDPFGTTLSSNTSMTPAPTRTRNSQLFIVVSLPPMKHTENKKPACNLSTEEIFPSKKSQNMETPNLMCRCKITIENSNPKGNYSPQANWNYSIGTVASATAHSSRSQNWQTKVTLTSVRLPERPSYPNASVTLWARPIAELGKPTRVGTPYTVPSTTSLATVPLE